MSLKAMLPKEDAFIHKRDGTIAGPYSTSFAGDTIIVFDQQADIEDGDKLIRTLPSGREQIFTIQKFSFFSNGPGNFGPHYQISAKETKKDQEKQQQINIQNAHSIQIGDHNQSQTIINSIESLIKLIELSNASESEKTEAKSRLSKFLEHPIVVAIVGAAAGGALGGS